MTLSGKVVLITGSSRGIGAGMARHFADRGALVVLHGRDGEALGQVEDDIIRSGGQALALTADLTRFNEIERLRQEVEHQWAPIDVLIANAGGTRTGFGPLERISEQTWRGTLDDNLTTAFLSINSVLPGMKERRTGNIVTISSGSARAAHEQSPVAYAAAKAGLEILTKNLAVQAGPYGVRANCIAPETIMTETNQQTIPEEVQQQMIVTHPVRRLGTPDDVAHAAAFLASDESTWISGTILDVSGAAIL